MKKPDTRQLTLYCWNLSNGYQDIRPLAVRAQSLDLKNPQVWDRLFVDLDNLRLYLEDFWKEEGSEASERLAFSKPEYQQAKEFAQRKVPQHRKFRQRYHRRDPKHSLVGKRTYTFNGMNYILLAFENDEEQFTKISVFSKRTNEFVLHRSIYYRSRAEGTKPTKLDLEGFQAIELSAEHINGSSPGLTQSKE